MSLATHCISYDPNCSVCNSGSPPAKLHFESDEQPCGPCGKNTPHKQFGDLLRCSECGGVSATLTSTPANNWNNTLSASPPELKKLLDRMEKAAFQWRAFPDSERHEAEYCAARSAVEALFASRHQCYLEVLEELKAAESELSSLKEQILTPELIERLEMIHESTNDNGPYGKLAHDCAAWNNNPEDCNCKYREVNMKILALRRHISSLSTDI